MKMGPMSVLVPILIVLFQSTSTEVVPAFKHYVLLMHVYDEGVQKLSSPSEFRIEMKEINAEESLSIGWCTRHRANAFGEMNFGVVSMVYIRCVLEILGHKVSNTEPATKCKPSFANSCKKTIGYGTEFDPHYKTPFAEMLKGRGFGVSIDHNQLPNMEKTGKAVPGSKKPKTWDCESTVDHDQASDSNRTFETTQQREAEFSISTEAKAEISASLELSYEWLSLSVEASHSETHGSEKTQVSGQIKTTGFEVKYKMNPNKVFKIRDQTEYVASTRNVYVPFEATGWLVDMTGSIYACCCGCLYKDYNNITSAILFPVGDMATYFPEQMTKISANSMLFHGPSISVTGYKSERYFHVKEFLPSEMQCF